MPTEGRDSTTRISCNDRTCVEPRMATTLEKSQLHSSSDSSQTLRCEANRKQSEFERQGLITTVGLLIRWGQTSPKPGECLTLKFPSNPFSVSMAYWGYLHGTEEGYSPFRSSSGGGLLGGAPTGPAQGVRDASCSDQELQSLTALLELLSGVWEPKMEIPAKLERRR